MKKLRRDRDLSCSLVREERGRSSSDEDDGEPRAPVGRRAAAAGARRDAGRRRVGGASKSAPPRRRGRRVDLGGTGREPERWKREQLEFDAGISAALAAPFSGTSSRFSAPRRGQRDEKAGRRGFLIYPPAPFFRNAQNPLDTASQTLEAFEATYATYRSGMPSVRRSRAEEAGIPVSDPEVERLLLRSAREGVPTVCEPGMESVTVFVWRPSPTFNWRVMGKAPLAADLREWLGLFGREGVARDGRATGWYRGGRGRGFHRRGAEEAEGVLDAEEGGPKRAKVPELPIVADVSLRLEVIFLAYRYCALVLNEANEESERRQMPTGGGDQFDSAHMLEVSKDIVEKLERAFSIAVNVIQGLLASWATLSTPPECAELSLECCQLVQHLVMCMRLWYAVRVARLNHSLEIQYERIADTPLAALRRALPGSGGGLWRASEEIQSRSSAGETTYWGLTLTRISRIFLGAATSALKAHALFEDYVDLVFGGRRCPEEDDPLEYSPHPHPPADMLRDYMEEKVLMGLAMCLYYTALRLDEEHDERPNLLDRGESEWGDDHRRYRELPFRISALSLCGLATLRPFAVCPEKYAAVKDSGALATAFERLIGKYAKPISERYSKVGAGGVWGAPGEGGLGSLAFPRYPPAEAGAEAGDRQKEAGGDAEAGARRAQALERPADFNSLFDYFCVVREYLGEENCDYLLKDTAGAEAERYHRYPLDPEEFRVAYYDGATAWIAIEDHVEARSGVGGSGGVFVSERETAAAAWARLVSEWEGEGINGSP